MLIDMVCVFPNSYQVLRDVLECFKFYFYLISQKGSSVHFITQFKNSVLWIFLVKGIVLKGEQARENAINLQNSKVL